VWDSSLFVIKYVFLGISLAAPVGPINIEMIRRGISGGFFQSWLVGLGGMSADIIFLLFIFIGAVKLLTFPIVVFCMYMVGAVVLIKLGLSSIIESFKHTREEANKETNTYNSYLTGLFIAFVNPLNFVFWFGVYGSTLTNLTTKYSMSMSLLYSLLILVGVALWNLNIAFTVHFARDLVNERVLRIVTFFAGCVLLWFGGDFLLKAIVEFKG
jgi:threonine/homoserine/homoserine lactone efflux protein